MGLLPLLLAFAASTSISVQNMNFYIGTYTSKNGSKGIYRSTLNAQTGAISAPELAAEIEGPSFLALHPKGSFLYAVQESGGGAVSSFEVGPDGALNSLNSQPYVGAGPCHVTVDPTGKNLLSAGYGDGSVACFPIQPDGSLLPPSAMIKNTGTGPDKNRQEGPHMHSAYVDPSGKYVLTCDLGTDEVLVYRFDPEKGLLTPNVPKAGKTPPGGGPRHLAIHPKNGRVYANNEMLNSVTVFAFDPKAGTLKEMQTISTLPEGHPNQGTTAEIVLHPSGKWLYVSNRGHDSIAAYEVLTDGKLRLVEIELAGVREPRGMDIDPSGAWLVVGGQNSNDITSLKIDPATGKLEPSGVRTPVGRPVCILFAKK